MSTTTTAAATVFRLVFTVPEAHLSACKTAIFAAGAGRYPHGDYTQCCFTTGGTGQFRPGPSANPHLGTAGQVEEVREVRVETPCADAGIVRLVVAALKKAHPYETPSYQVYRVEDF